MSFFFVCCLYYWKLLDSFFLFSRRYIRKTPREKTNKQKQKQKSEKKKSLRKCRTRNKCKSPTVGSFSSQVK